MRIHTIITLDESEIFHAEQFLRHIETKTDTEVPAKVLTDLQTGRFEVDKVVSFTKAAAEAYRMFLETMFDIGFELAIRLPLLKGYVETFSAEGAMTETDLLQQPVADSKHVA